jgi:predicted GNAT family N-acyltransferase
MKIRVRVFVDEQHCSADAEIDSDDVRSWQWVIYASSSPSEDHQSSSSATSATSTATSTPVAVIRLVPPPQPPHDLLTNPGNINLPAYDWTHEPCIKLTRVAVLPEYRGYGLGRRLVETALSWATEHAGEIDAAAGELARQDKNKDLPDGGVEAWRGLVLVHAQVDVERMYSGLGFVKDEGLGRWDEEGIEHVGMFRRLEVR